MIRLAKMYLVILTFTEAGTKGFKQLEKPNNYANTALQ